jgi:site-specific DNA recombinase
MSELLRPNDPHIKRVVIVARISTVNQDPTALSAQIDLCKRYMQTHFAGPFEFQIISSQGSGEILDRQELRDLQTLILERRVDFVVAEDAGRIVRRMDIFKFCEDCEDNDVRLIAINDKIDTGDGNWRLSTMFVAMKHEQSNVDTSARIRRQLNYNFEQGRAIMHLPPGLDRPASKLDTDLRWEPSHRQLYRVAFFLVERGWSVVRLAQWLRGYGVNLDNKKMRRLLNNYLFVGERHRGRTASRRHNRTGHHIPRRTEASNLKIRQLPELAIINRKRFDRVQLLLAERGEKCIVGRNGKADTRKGHPRKETAFPGQRITCGVCGRMWYWGGHGQTHHMSCSGERQYKCWVTATFDGNEARKLICEAILKHAAQIEGFGPLVCQTVREESVRCLAERDRHGQELRRELAQRQKEAENLLAAIRAGGSVVELLVTELTRLQDAISSIKRQVAETERQPKPTVSLPTVETLRVMLAAAMEKVLAKPTQIQEQLNRLVPSIVVHPVMPIDGGNVVIRATVTLNLAALITPGDDLAERLPALQRVITVNLFKPPQRIEILPKVMKALAENPGAMQKWVAVNVTKTSATVVQRAVVLSEKMELAGLTDPYVAVTDPEWMTGKNKKHTRQRFRFEPLPGFPTWHAGQDPAQEDRPAA